MELVSIIVYARWRSRSKGLHVVMSLFEDNDVMSGQRREGVVT